MKKKTIKKKTLTENDKSILFLCHFAKNRERLAFFLEKANTERCRNIIKAKMLFFTKEKE